MILREKSKVSIVEKREVRYNKYNQYLNIIYGLKRIHFSTYKKIHSRYTDRILWWKLFRITCRTSINLKS